MLASRGWVLLGVASGLAAAGLVLQLPAALSVGVVVAVALTLELRRLRRALPALAPPWTVVARLRSPNQVASSRVLLDRSQRVGQPVVLELVFDVDAAFDGVELQPLQWHSTAGMEVALPAEPLRLRAGSPTRVRIEAMPAAAAVHRVFGLHAALIDALGLLRAEVFLPCSYEVAVLPRSWPLEARHLAETRRDVQRAAGGVRPDRVAGQGDELRELREHQPGDAFKHIAWKASARRGRLMSRVFEHERARAIYAVLDAGSTMREGRLGASALDFGLDFVHSLAETASRQNLPFGLAVVDGEVVERIPVREGLAALRQCDRALLDIRRPVAERLTPMDEEPLLQLVGDYLGSVERVHLPPITNAATWVATRQRTVMAALARLPERERSPLLRGPEPSARADLSILRRFCRATDLALPYRQALSAAERVQGLVDGVQAARASRKGPFVLLIVSDFRGLRGALEPLWRSAAAARAAGHRVVVVSVGEHDAMDVHSLLADGARVGAGLGDDADTALGLARADFAARTATLETVADGARRAGAAFVADPAPGRLPALWAAGVFA